MRKRRRPRRSKAFASALADGDDGARERRHECRLISGKRLHERLERRVRKRLRPNLVRRLPIRAQFEVLVAEDGARGGGGGERRPRAPRRERRDESLVRERRAGEARLERLERAGREAGARRAGAGVLAAEVELDSGAARELHRHRPRELEQVGKRHRRPSLFERLERRNRLFETNVRGLSQFPSDSDGCVCAPRARRRTPCHGVVEGQAVQHWDKR
mmetsp:Transcript_28129/g.91905  ORF Transcript_28129/g.91905 Transcript_28129/m.91905 type:complete len:217 (-) Transcript_28129:110-760(-)